MKEARMKKRISRKELAADVGCSAATIAGIENGWRMPSLPLALRIAKRLNRSVEALFYANFSDKSPGQ